MDLDTILRTIHQELLVSEDKNDEEEINKNQVCERREIKKVTEDDLENLLKRFD